MQVCFARKDDTVAQRRNGTKGAGAMGGVTVNQGREVDSCLLPAVVGMQPLMDEHSMR